MAEESTAGEGGLLSKPSQEAGQGRFYAVRVASNQERILILIIADRVKQEGIPIKGILFNDKVKGYLFVEADKDEDVMRAIYGIRHVKGLVREPIPFEEIKRMIEVREEPAKPLSVGDIVEITSGTFKGEVAKVIEVDNEKGICTVVPTDAPVAIPIKIKTSDVKLVEKAEG